MSYGQAVELKDGATGVSAQITSKGLKVDTEMTLSGDVTIENVTIARDDAGNEKKLRVDSKKNLYVTVPADTPLNISGDVRIDSIGSPQQRATVAVSDSATQISITSGKRHMEVYNEGTGDIYWGGSDVISANGIPIFDDYSREFKSCQSSFSVYLICATGETATARIVEYA